MNAKPEQTVENPGHYEEEEDGLQVESTDLTLMTSGAEIDRQISTARHFPRSLTTFRKQITELVTLDEDVARSCIYVLPRDGKNIEGASARFAELLVSCWGNNRTGGRIVGHDDEFVTGEGFFFDLEKNTAITYQVKRRITDKRGNLYSADMIMVTGNAAASIAHRNASLKGIPRALWGYAYDQAKKIIAGNAETLAERRATMLKELMVQGATKDQIFNLVGVKGIDDITLDHMVTLGGVYTAIKEGDTSVDDVYAANPNHVGPPRPTQSEFERKPATGKKAETTAKPAAEGAKPKEDPKPESAKAADTKPAAAETKPAEEPRGANQDLLDFVKDGMAELAACAKVGFLPEIRDRIGEQLEGAILKDWNAACEARQRDILLAARKK